MNKCVISSIATLGLLASVITVSSPALSQPSVASNLASNTPTTSSKASFNEASFARTFSHRTAEVNGGVKLHYVIGGKGDPIVLLHGWPTTWYEWRRMMPALAERYTVIVPDLRGLGDSDKPLKSGNKGVTAADIYELGQQLGFKRIFLVGHDWGTSVAFALVHEHPEFVRRVVFTENIIPGLGIPSSDWDTLNSRYWHHGFHASPDLPEALIQGKERLYLTDFYKRLTYNWSAFTQDDINEFVRAYSQPGALRAGFGYYRAITEDARQNREYAKHQLQMPVMVITGDHAVNQTLHQQLRPVVANYRGTILKNTGHFLPIERPNEFTALLLKFLSEEQR